MLTNRPDPEQPGGAGVDRALTADAWREAFAEAAAAVEQARPLLNRLNVFPVPDGDTGTNLSGTLRSAGLSAERSPAKEVAGVVQDAVGPTTFLVLGNSGVIMNEWLAGFARGLAEQAELTPRAIQSALTLAAEGARAALAEPVPGTMISAMEAAAQVRPGRTVRSSLTRAAKGAWLEALKSVDILPAARMAGVPDSGALGFAVFLNAIARSLNGKRPRALPPAVRALEVGPEWRSRMAARQLDFGVCMKFELETASDPNEVRRHFLPGHTSVVVGGTPPRLLIHLHSMDPNATVAQAQTLGTVSRLYLSDLNEEAGSFLKPRKTALVTVVDGVGWQRLFDDIGVVTLDAGAGSETLKSRIEGTTRGVIVLLDRRVASGWRAPRRAKVRQLRLANPPKTLAAALAFNSDEDLAVNLEAMRRNASHVRVYEAESDEEAVRLGRLRTAGIITLFCGAGVDEGAANAVADQISKAVTARVDYIYGGQAEPRYWLAFQD